MEGMARAPIGHNGGPPLVEPQRPRTYSAYCWRRAQAAAWRRPPYEVMMLRLRRARTLGMTCREYTAVILDRGVYLQPPKVSDG